jgi:alpha-D-xyloside xylohydrolase
VASRTGLPPMRPLFVDFPADPGIWDVDDEFMFGPDLLVAPVLEPGAPTRDVRLPGGAVWISAATGERHDGGTFVRVPLSPDHIPVFARAEAEVLDVVR